MGATDYLLRRALQVTGRGKLSILIYHRVLANADPLFPGLTDARRFDDQMSWVGRELNVIPLDAAVGMLQERRLPPRAACVTFDDGYADNCDVAAPILRRHRLPATIFVSTGFIDGGRMWNDTIIESIRRARGPHLDLGSAGLGRHSLDSHADRRAAIDSIIDQVKYLPPAQRLAQVDAVAKAADAALPDDLMMRSEQVRSLDRDGMTIGAHTVTHPILAQLGEAEALAEIRGSRDVLNSILGRRVGLFAYPNGKPGIDYGPAHVAMVRDLGFDAAVSTRAGAAEANGDRYQLPRFTPWAKDSLRFGISLARNNLGHY